MTPRLVLREPGYYRLEGTVDFGTPMPPALWSPDIVPANGRATIELGGLERADSVALALLVEWGRRARAAGFRLVIADAPERLRALIRVTGLEALLAEGV